MSKTGENAGKSGALRTREEEALWNALKHVEDPELPISVVDLGLIYHVVRRGSTVTVEMTLTSSGCPCVELLLDDVRKRLLREPGVRQVEVELVWEPPWTRDRLSSEAIERLKCLGIAV